MKREYNTTVPFIDSDNDWLKFAQLPAEADGYIWKKTCNKGGVMKDKKVVTVMLEIELPDDAEALAVDADGNLECYTEVPRPVECDDGGDEEFWAGRLCLETPLVINWKDTLRVVGGSGS